MLSRHIIEQGVVPIPFYDTQQELRKPLHYEPEVAKQIHQLYKFQNDQPEADQEGHSSRTMDSLTQHKVSLLPHSKWQGDTIASSVSGGGMICIKLKPSLWSIN